MNYENLIGKQFNSFTVVGEASHKIRTDGKKVRQWRCVCECGNERLLNRRELITGKRKSCGCKHSFYAAQSNTRHGDSHTRLHNIWSGMIERCHCPTEYHYKWYGGRGISVCKAWKESYETFREWALANGYTENLTIDRIDNDGDYCPGNCRWVDMKTQANNTRRNHFITAYGKTKTLTQWSEEAGVSASTIRKRLKLGWDAESAIGGIK